MKINSELAKLKTMDVYSMMLFALFKVRECPEYSALSELAYILDKENFLKLCEYFGGLTIKIPTIDELESLLYALILYQYVDIDNIPIETATEIISKSASDMRHVKNNYVKIKNILQDYQFSTRQQEEIK